jgi:hypothetical protein
MTSDRTILITGVTGNQGGAVAQALQGTGFHLRGLTRKPDSERAAARWPPQCIAKHNSRAVSVGACALTTHRTQRGRANMKFGQSIASTYPQQPTRAQGDPGMTNDVVTVIRKDTFRSKPFYMLAVAVMLASALIPAGMRAQAQIMGELQFAGATKVEKNSGVWIDRQYVGYLKELKGDKKIVLLPGEHEFTVRQAGYNDFTKTVIVEPRQVQLFVVTLQRDPRTIYPAVNAASLRLDVTPGRAAVFVDDGYIGHASDFGGAFHSMLVTPEKHRVKIELPGYRTFETEINPLAGQKTEIKTELISGSIEQAGALVKEP